MAGQTLLIVDSDAANLKMAAAALRREGYRVQVASSGEQALSMLRTVKVDLMLVSMALPGINGAEVIASVKGNPQTREVISVAMLGPISEYAERAAVEAGAEGCLTKPLDPIELAQRVRNYLNPQPSPAFASAEFAEIPERVPLSGPEVEDLRRSFAADGARESRALVSSLGTSFDASQARLAAQHWATLAYTLGFEEISRHARAVTQALGSQPYDRSGLRCSLTYLMDAFQSAAAGAQAVLPETVRQRLRGKHITLVGFADREAERICEALERVGAFGRLFDAGQEPESEAVQNCALILVHVRPESVIPWLSAAPTSSRPLVLVGRIEDLLALDPATQDRACEFLIDGWQPEEVVMRLGLILSRATIRQETPQAVVIPPVQATPKTGEVLVVDDDSNIRDLMRTVLEKQGIRWRVAGNGAEGIEMIRQYRPSVALLDVNMPVMGGFEVLAQIRAEAYPVKVVMLTAREQESDILQGFALGADDYVVKPFNPKEVVARVKRLL